MLRQEINALWLDARASNRSQVPWGRHIVSFFCALPSLSFFLAAIVLLLMNFLLPSPNAKRILSPADKDLLEQYGAAVVECSWVRVKEVPWSRIGGKCERLRMELEAAFYYTVFLTFFSTLPCCCKLGKLRTSMAAQLRRSAGSMLLHLRTRGLGRRGAEALLLWSRIP